MKLNGKEVKLGEDTVVVYLNILAHNLPECTEKPLNILKNS
jgi:hypothetical protein